MSPRWLWGCAVLWVVLTIMSNVIEQLDPLTAANMTVLGRLTTYQHVEVADPLGSFFAGAGTLLTMVGAVWDILWFNYSFLQDNFLGQMARYIMGIPLTVAMFFYVGYILRSMIAR